MMANDSAVGLGKGSAMLGTTPADARAQLAALRSPDGAYSKAVAAATSTGNLSEMNRLQPEIQRLTKIAAGG